LLSLRSLLISGGGNFCLSIPMEIVALSLRDSKITSVGKLSNLTNLRFLDLSQNFLDNCAPLKRLVNLEHLNISVHYYKQGKVVCIKFVKKMKNLVYFNANGNRISDISPFKKLKEIRTLLLNYNPIQDISDINGL